MIFDAFTELAYRPRLFLALIVAGVGAAVTARVVGR